MTTTPSDPTTALPGRPPVVDLATWQAARDELLVREKANTREGDALAAARRRLPMVELDGAVEVVGHDGPVPFPHRLPSAVSVISEPNFLRCCVQRGNQTAPHTFVELILTSYLTQRRSSSSRAARKARAPGCPQQPRI